MGPCVDQCLDVRFTEADGGSDPHRAQGAVADEPPHGGLRERQAERDFACGQELIDGVAFASVIAHEAM